ncbi:hypothetical protein OPV22_006898 [Ensete ventricosum]|uniref:Protein ABIL2-like n=1 Tax=Ensete ventricosum TaxID=4639 RepID=A0AAV8RMD0_ENSVE|nr:hypothetical protein OPV22_006898 [Ensete ventricosum]
MFQNRERCSGFKHRESVVFPFYPVAVIAARISVGSNFFLSPMEIVALPSTSEMFNHQDASNFDELSMEQSLLFSDTLKDLKKLKLQLYSAAEYFELSYATDDHKQLVFNTLKEYATKALVNTVDHLGLVSFKINCLLDEKVDELSGAEFRVSSIEQRIRTCQELVDHECLLQQSLMIKAPSYSKQYTLPVGESMPDSGRHVAQKYVNLNADNDNNTEPYKSHAVHLTKMVKQPSFRKMLDMSPLSPRKVHPPLPSPQPKRFFGAEKKIPCSLSNPIAQSRSFITRSTEVNSLLSIAAQSSSQTQKLASLSLPAEWKNRKDSKQNQSNGKKFLKSLLARPCARKGDLTEVANQNLYSTCRHRR